MEGCVEGLQADSIAALYAGSGLHRTVWRQRVGIFRQTPGARMSKGQDNQSESLILSGIALECACVDGDIVASSLAVCCKMSVALERRFRMPDMP